MLNLRYRGLRIVPTLSAAREMADLGMMLLDVQEVLESGYSAPRLRRKGTIEKWLSIGKKTYNVVLVKDHDEYLNEEIWLIIHRGRFSRKSIK